MIHRKHASPLLVLVLFLLSACSGSPHLLKAGPDERGPTPDRLDETLADLRRRVSFPIFVPAKVPEGMALQAPSWRDPVVELVYLDKDGRPGLLVLNGPAGCCLDADPRKAAGATRIREGITGYFLPNQPEFGGPILWWQEAGAYIALSGPHLTRDALVEIAAFMSAQAIEASATLTAPAQDVWATLRERPIELPTLTPGAPCPVTEVREVLPGQYLLGKGPIYVHWAAGNPPLRYGRSVAEGGWHYVKVLWRSSGDYQGPALIRGRQLDGPNELRFERGENPPDEMQFPVDPGVSSAYTVNGWRDRPSYTRIRSAGCYAWQVDGLDFRSVIVFRAEP